MLWAIFLMIFLYTMKPTGEISLNFCVKGVGNMLNIIDAITGENRYV